MPRNRRPQDREEKQAEIVAVARRLFVEDGFDVTPMSTLAAAAGIAANTIYWYFRDKDAVLLAVLDDVVTDAWAAYLGESHTSLADRVLWIVDRLEHTGKLISTVHARVLVSDAVHEWHEQFHALTELVLRGELVAAGVEDGLVDDVVKIWVFTVEGLLLHSLDEQRKRSICDTLVRQLR